MKFFCLVFILTLFGSTIAAQTCCSGGLPIANNLGFEIKDKGSFQFLIQYDFRHLDKLFEEQTLLDDRNRLRTTHAAIARVAYSFHSRLNVEMMLPYINQNRMITQNSGLRNTERTFGIGDISIFSQYLLFQNVRYAVTGGLGIKMPTGKNDAVNSLGFRIINDMQPGSGSWDVLGRMSYVWSPALRPAAAVQASVFGIYKGTDNQYLGSERYRFGHEFQVMAGYTEQLFILKNVFNLSYDLRYRSAENDEINENLLDNTGGKWLFSRYALGLLFQNYLEVRISFEHPFYTKVTGTQLSPDYNLGISIHKTW